MSLLRLSPVSYLPPLARTLSLSAELQSALSDIDASTGVPQSLEASVIDAALAALPAYLANAANEPDAESVCAILLAKNAPRTVGLVMAPGVCLRPQSVLSLLAAHYNALPSSSSSSTNSKVQALTTLLGYAAQNNLESVLAPAAPRIEAFLDSISTSSSTSNNNNSSTSTHRSLWEATARLYALGGRPRDAYRLYVKVRAPEAALAQWLELYDVHDMQPLLEIAAPQSSTALTLEALQKGKVVDGAPKSQFVALGRVAPGTYTYAQLAQAIGVPYASATTTTTTTGGEEEAMENMVADAVASGWLQARIDAMHGSVHVAAGKSAVLGREQWDGMGRVLRRWQERVQQMGRVLEEAV